jgi:hypothetical protein
MDRRALSFLNRISNGIPNPVNSLVVCVLPVCPNLCIFIKEIRKGKRFPVNSTQSVIGFSMSGNQETVLLHPEQNISQGLS